MDIHTHVCVCARAHSVHMSAVSPIPSTHFFQKNKRQFLGAVKQAYNPSTQRLMQDDNSEFKASVGYVIRLHLKTGEEQEGEGERGKEERRELTLALSLQEYSGYTVRVSHVTESTSPARCHLMVPTHPVKLFQGCFHSTAYVLA